MDLTTEKADQVYSELYKEEAESQAVDPAQMKHSFMPQYETQEVQEVPDENFMGDHGNKENSIPPLQLPKKKQPKGKARPKKKDQPRGTAMDLDKSEPPAEESNVAEGYLEW